MPQPPSTEDYLRIIDRLLAIPAVATALAQSIRLRLPVRGLPRPFAGRESDPGVTAEVLNLARKLEKLLNPTDRPFEHAYRTHETAIGEIVGKPGSVHQSLHLDILALLDAHSAIVEHYGWQGTVTKWKPYSQPWEWPNVPAIDPGLLGALEHAADNLRQCLGSWQEGLKGQKHASPVASEEQLYLMHHTGRMWHLRFGQEQGDFSDKVRGFGYIARLLECPNKPIPALILMGSALEAANANQLQTDATDQEAKVAYKKDLDRILEELADATERENQKEALKLEAEKAKLLERRKATSGPGGNGDE